MRWFIDAAPGARIETIYLGGYDGRDSEVYVNDTLADVIILEDRTYSYRAQGKPFCTLLETLTKKNRR